MIKKKIILQLNSIITTQIISTFCIIFAVLATLCKESGIIVAGAVAMAALLEPVSYKQRVIRSLSIFALLAILVATSSLIR